MSLGNLEFLLSEALVGIRRNMLMAFASVTTMALALALLGGALLAILSLERFAERQPAKFEMAVFLDRDLSRQRALNICDRVAHMPQVKQAKLVLKEKAWPQFRVSLQGKVDVSGVEGNPLPDAIRIKVKDPRQTGMAAAAIRQIPGVDQVNECKEQLRKVLALADFVKFIGTAIAIGLALAVMFIISNTIRLTVHARRREIGIMQLVSATNWFIRMPLIFEGIILGAIGGALGVLFVVGGSAYLSSVALRMMPLLEQFSSGVRPTQLALDMTSAGAIIGAMGSFISVRRFLRA